MSKAVAGVLLAVLFTVVPARIQGGYSNRWEIPSELRHAAARIDDFPRSLGPWQMQGEGKPLSDRVGRELGLVGYVSRVYVHCDNGRVVNLLLMAGQPGRLVRHPPYLCYRSLGNRQIGDVELMRASSQGAEHAFSVMEFQRDAEALSARFLVAYAFSTGSNWDSPSWPRVAYGAAPLLYKVQLLAALETSDRRAALETQQSYLHEFANAFADWHAQLVDR